MLRKIQSYFFSFYDRDLYAIDSDFHTSYSQSLGFGAELDLIGGMSGCLTALTTNIPDWLQKPFTQDRILQQYPIQQSAGQDSQFKLFE